jgi:uncharacterized protein YjdB
MNALKRTTRTLFCSIGFLATALIAGCGGGDQGRDPVLGLPAAELVSVAVTPATPSVAIGGAQQFAATATYSDGSSRDVTTGAAWTSATPAVATVNATSGKAAGVSAGSSVISAGFNGKNGSATLTVVPAALVSIALLPANPLINVGGTQQLIAMGTYSDNSTRDVTATSTFTSATPAVATVGATSALAQGVSPGTALVTAKSGAISASTTVTVNAAVLSSIAVTPATASVAVGAKQQYVAIGTYSDNTTAIITNSVNWTSTAPSAASVLNTGVATGVAVGTTTITATSGTTSGSAALNVTATAVPPPVSAGLNLRSAASFAVLAGTSITNNSGGTTLITGDVGSPSQTTDPTQAAGFTNYKSGAILNGALADLQTAISDANGRTCDVNFAGGIDLGGVTLAPGVYCYAGAISITGTLTLNGPGVYIFRTPLTLNSTANSIVALANGATADNVSWLPVGPTTLGANSVFKGSILGQSAAITVGDNTTLLNGRVLTAAAVTLRNNQITK